MSTSTAPAPSTTQGHTGFHEVAAIEVDPTSGLVHELGWQSWSPSTVYPVAAPRSIRPVAPRFQTSAYRPGKPAPATGFQAEGLLAVEPAPGAPVHVVSLRDGRAEVPSVRARLSGRTLVVEADGDVDHGVDEGPDGLHGALARFADTYAARVGVPPLRDVPPLWASWYQYFTEFTEQDMVADLDAMDRLELPVGIVRLDDAFQAEVGDWLVPSERFTSLDGMVGQVLDRGRAAGIWTAPMLVGARSATFADHPDWLVQDAGGVPVVVQHNWDQDCYVLDITHPAAAAYLREVFTTYARYGVTYFMVDFMYAGAVEGVRHDEVTGIAAYRAALELVRESIGPDALLQGCGAPMFPSVGLVDTMRVGADIAPSFHPRDGELSDPGTESAIISTVGRAFTQGRFWVNDPDCFSVRPEVERRELWADVVAEYGGVRISSDRLDDLDDWGLEATRRLLVPARTEPFSTGVPLRLDL